MAAKAGKSKTHHKDRLGSAVDVSVFQGDINWDAVATAHPVAFAKATEGVSYRDPRFTSGRVDAMKHAKLAAGFYHFARPDNNSPQSEAEHFVRTVRNAGGNLIHYGDWKHHRKDGQIGVLDFETAPFSASWAVAFGKRYHELTKSHCLLYGYGSSIGPVAHSLDVFAGVWLAAYVSDWHHYWPGNPSDVKFWQYTDHGTCPGIHGAVDLSRYLG